MSAPLAIQSRRFVGAAVKVSHTLAVGGDDYDDALQLSFISLGSDMTSDNRNEALMIILPLLIVLSTLLLLILVFLVCVLILRRKSRIRCVTSSLASLA